MALTIQQLTLVLSETFSPDGNTRRTAEARLTADQVSPEHLMSLLRLIQNTDAADASIRQAAAVHFKNTVKKGWDVNNEDGTSGIVISLVDRNTIKTHLVQLMCTVSSQIQAQLSESISLIATVDYPAQWENLLPELVQRFSSTDPAVVVGVLKTANSIFKSFRDVARCDDLYRTILHSLGHIQEPLLKLFQQIHQEIVALVNDPVQLKPRFEALRLICRIFYSLNYQDLPEYFEDHMKEWMEGFGFYLQYQNPALVDPDEETEPSVIDKVQGAIIQNLSLYTSKDEEEFTPYLPHFTKLVWGLLMQVSAMPKHDTLATTSIRFLSSLVQKQMHIHLFQGEGTLREIVLKIVIPNLTFRESDQERFEEDPSEYMVTEVEGSDSESRRKCSQDLLSAMCRHFETEATGICNELVVTMLTEFAKDPNGQWAAKDAAIHLMMGIAIRKDGIQGVTEVNPGVNVLTFFENHILPELRDANHMTRPVVKAASIKFVSVFRNQFTREQLVQLMPLLIAQLGSPIVVVHTFAAYTIERILLAKEVGTNQPKISKADLQPFLQSLLVALFAISDQNANNYGMKCVARALSKAGADVIPIAEYVVTKLTETLSRVTEALSRDSGPQYPTSPQFHHYLFESIAGVVRCVCSADAAATLIFEGLLLVPFNASLQNDVTELTPYVFQVLAQLLEYRPREAGLGEAYTVLLPLLLTASPWVMKGNVPALTRLVQVYIKKYANELYDGSLGHILGVFQKLLSVPATEVSAFGLLSSAVAHFPPGAIGPQELVATFSLLLTRLNSSQGQKPKYKRLTTQFFALFVGKYGGQVFLNCTNSIQAGLAGQLIAHVWSPHILNDPPTQRVDSKVQVIGLTKLLCETPALLADANVQQMWAQTLASLVTVLSSPTFTAAANVVVDAEAETASEMQYDSQYSKLTNVFVMVEDPFPEVADASAFFVQSLQRLMASQPGQLMPLIQRDPKLVTGLDSLFQQNGVRLA